MRETYKNELLELENRMINAEAFAKKIPVFEEYIINNKITWGNDCSFWEYYKSLYLGWGINRKYYPDNSNITNYKKDYKWFLFTIYFNTLSMYDSYEKYWLEELTKTGSVFFFDKANSTFYIKDEHIGLFLEEANKWYEKAKNTIKIEEKKIRIKQLEAELDLLLTKEQWK